MATVRDVVNGAIQRLGVVEIGEQAEAEAGELGLAIYNALHQEAVADGWLPAFTVATLDSAVALGAAYVEPLKAEVAVRMAGDYGVIPTPMLRMQGAQFLARLASVNYTPATFERDFRYEDVDNEYDAGSL